MAVTLAHRLSMRRWFHTWVARVPHALPDTCSCVPQENYSAGIPGHL